MAKKKMGRPSIYSDELACEICFRLSRGDSLNRICKDPKMPEAVTVWRWLNDGKHEEFCKKYARAREYQAEYIFNDLLDIADDGSNDFLVDKDGNPTKNMEHIMRSRLRVDTRKWYLSKIVPKVYGDKSSKDVNINVNISEEIEEARRRARLNLRGSLN